jgi:23S rRNA (uracil1939-C5)-methyltransferase
MSRGAGPDGPGGVIEVVVEKGVYRGQGLARLAGQVVLVPRGLPGDRLRVRVGATRRGMLRAETLERIADGPGRRPSPCAVSAACGGCAYQELDYPAQLALKEAILRESLARAGAAYDGEIPLTPSPEAGWRTRASLHGAAGEDGAYRVGLHAEGSHRIVAFDPCLQLSPRANAAVRALGRVLGARPDLARRVERLDLAESDRGEELLVGFEGRLAAEDGPRLAAAAAEIPEITGCAFRPDRAGRRPFAPLRGAPYVHANVLGRRLRAHLSSFFQANRFLVERLASAVLELVPGDGTVLDLYAGVGLFTVPLAARGQDVFGCEISSSAVQDARANARGLRARFREADVARALRDLPRGHDECVVLDPPRTGAGAAVVEGVAARRPRVVVYVSCDPPTLGRDLAHFARLGYRPRRLTALDMFPDTFHVETVASLVPA